LRTGVAPRAAPRNAIVISSLKRNPM